MNGYQNPEEGLGFFPSRFCKSLFASLRACTMKRWIEKMLAGECVVMMVRISTLRPVVAQFLVFFVLMWLMPMEGRSQGSQQQRQANRQPLAELSPEELAGITV